jgi:hypothetical protein
MRCLSASLLVGALVLSGCATAADFPSQPTILWGYRGELPNGLVFYSWLPDASTCDRDRAAGKANNPTYRYSRCQSLSVYSGGPLWGVTSPGYKNYGIAVDQQGACDTVRKLAKILQSLHSYSKCSPVSVNPSGSWTW